jgi:hypothetical protein
MPLTTADIGTQLRTCFVHYQHETPTCWPRASRAGPLSPRPVVTGMGFLRLTIGKAPGRGSRDTKQQRLDTPCALQDVDQLNLLLL